MKQVFIVQGRAEHLSGLYQDEILKGNNIEYSPCWTCPSQVRKGDTMLIYLMSPISAIVGKAIFSSEPFLMNDLESEWYGWRMATYEKLEILPEENFISRLRLNELFPQWYWTRRPQGATQVPDLYSGNLLDLLNFQNSGQVQKNLFN